MTDKERKAWLKSLKVGDEVASQCPGAGTDMADVVRIISISARTIVCGWDYIPRREPEKYFTNGRSTTGPQLLFPLTPEIREVHDRFLLERQLDEFRRLVKTLPITTVRRILAVLKEANEEGKESKDD